MKELVIISGKGGTGKTSISAAFASLAKNTVFADCDVDAADLHLILKPQIKEENIFKSGHEAIVNEQKCVGCGKCMELCRFEAIRKNDNDIYMVDPIACEGCGVCAHFCPVNAIDFPEAVCGKWYISDTRFGTMVHARLDIAAENSGKLVSMVREQAKKIAIDSNSDMVLIDGPPGIGCPVIASVANVNAVLIVTEPTMSGVHDLQRVVGLCRHFGIKTMVCVNKWDINKEISEKIQQNIEKEPDTIFVGKIAYDKVITAAQIAGKSVVEYDKENVVAKSINKIWETVWANVL